jgi:hypothetical protein
MLAPDVERGWAATIALAATIEAAFAFCVQMAEPSRGLVGRPIAAAQDLGSTRYRPESACRRGRRHGRPGQTPSARDGRATARTQWMAHVGPMCRPGAGPIPGASPSVSMSASTWNEGRGPAVAARGGNSRCASASELDTRGTARTMKGTSIDLLRQPTGSAQPSAASCSQAVEALTLRSRKSQYARGGQAHTSGKHMRAAPLAEVVRCE